MAEAAVRKFTINFGPQHPAAHGVLRLVLENVQFDGQRTGRLFHCVAWSCRSGRIPQNSDPGSWGMASLKSSSTAERKF
jgi:hypothetical protein